MQNLRNSPPESGINRLKQFSSCVLPQQASQKQCTECAGSQVTPADIKHQIRPGPAKSHQKQQVRRCAEALPNRPQKTMPHAQQHSQQKTGHKPPDSNHRYRHPNSRRQPPSRGSS